MIPCEKIKDGAWRSWPCGNCGECLDRGPVWDKEAGGWRCQNCGHFDRDAGRPSATWVDWLSVFLGGCFMLFVFLVFLKTLGLIP